MTETRLKKQAGLFILLAHVLSVLLVVALFFLGGFTFEQMTTSVAIITPMFAGVTTQIVGWFTEHQYVADDLSRPVTPEYRLLTYAWPAILGVLIWCATLAQAASLVFDDFEQYKLALVFFEGLFAAYAARFMKSLFGAPAKAQAVPAE